jgi:hypothetical protein
MRKRKELRKIKEEFLESQSQQDAEDSQPAKDEEAPQIPLPLSTSL